MRARGRGFTLIETVIAFAIVAISLAALYQAFGLSMRREQRASDETLALLHLASLRDRLGFDVPIRPGATSGRFDERFRWQIDARPVAPGDSHLPLATAMQITVTVQWERDEAEQAVSVQSLESVPPG